MATAYTSLLGLALPVTGELTGTWGTTVNDYITQYLDAAVAGAQVISGNQTAVTLSTTNGSSLVQAGGAGVTGSAQYSIIRCTGNPASLLTITAPTASKVYLIINATSTSQSVKIVASGPTTGVTVASGKSALVAWSGSDYALVATTDASSLSGTLAIANGGTGQTTATEAFDALAPTTTLGDTIYRGASDNLRLAGNTTTTKNFLSQTGTGSVSAAPAWSTVTKSDVGLSNVENTALSTWAGSSNITTVGTIGTGTWQGGVISPTYGGTGVNNGSRNLTISTFGGTISFPGVGTTMTFPSATTTIAGLGTTQTFTGVNTFATTARTSGAAPYFIVTTPADTGITASTESIGVEFTAATRTWATGTVNQQRERVFSGPGYAFAGPSTMTLAVNVDIEAPVAGTNATITNAYALRAAASQFTSKVDFTTATESINIGTSQTTGATTIGGASQTGAITIGQATGNQTVNIATGTLVAAATKTLNIGTGGTTGNTTQINVGNLTSRVDVAGKLSINNTGAITTDFYVSGSTSLGVTTVRGAFTGESLTNVFGPSTGTSTGTTSLDLQGRTGWPTISTTRFAHIPGGGLYSSDFQIQEQTGSSAFTTHIWLLSGGNFGVGVSPSYKLDVNGTARFSGGAATPPVAVTFSATAMTVNCALSNVFTTTFTANVTTAPTLSSPQDGQTINWFITQDATGSRTMTWPTSFKWPGGTAGVLSTGANAVDLVTATYRSATGFWYATLLKAFS